MAKELVDIIVSEKSHQGLSCFSLGGVECLPPELQSSFLGWFLCLPLKNKQNIVLWLLVLIRACCHRRTCLLCWKEERLFGKVGVENVGAALTNWIEFYAYSRSSSHDPRCIGLTGGTLILNIYSCFPHHVTEHSGWWREGSRLEL